MQASTEVQRLKQAATGFEVVAGHPAMWINVRALTEALNMEKGREVFPYAYRSKQAADDVCVLIGDSPVSTGPVLAGEGG